MAAISEIVTLLVLIAMVAICLWVVKSWPEYLADALWQFVMYPKTVAAATAIVLFLVELPLQLLFGLSATSPLGFSIFVLIAPAAVCILSNLLAFSNAFRLGLVGGLKWRTFIFDAKWREQQDEYEVPRSNQ